jgi:hypothetical protein
VLPRDADISLAVSVQNCRAVEGVCSYIIGRNRVGSIRK